MKKSTVYYLVYWLGAVILFNLLYFVSINGFLEERMNDGGFWTGYVFITLAFVINLVFACILFKEKNKECKVMKMSLLMISNIEMVAIIVISAVCMLIPAIPIGVGIILCYFILFLSVVFTITTNIVVEKTENANELLNKKTILFRSLTDDAQILINKSTTPEIRELAQKVYDSIRYSDPISTEELYPEERIIQSNINKLCSIISDVSYTEHVNLQMIKILEMIQERNNKCRLLKYKDK